MSVIGIVCEFNPFHNGHKYLIDSVKKQGDVVVCVMSGNFVQRCEPAIFSKEIRAKSALFNGADIVLELPFLYATSSAEAFAYNAVKIIDSFGCDKIAFGTENSTVESLNKIVDILSDEKFDNELKKHLDCGESYPSARQLALKTFNDNLDLSLPNNILAVEYIKALRKIDSKIEPVCVNRFGADYNDDYAVDNFASATHLRNLINNGLDFEKYIPENIYNLYTDCILNGNIVSHEKYNLITLALLRSKLSAKSDEIANMAEGLENRIINAVKNCNNLFEIYDMAKTKRYTHSRIRRAVFCRQFDITDKDIGIEVPYCRLLGFNRSSAAVMGNLAKKCSLPFVTRYSEIEILDDNAKNVFRFEEKSSDLYNLVLKKADVCSKEKTFSPIKI